MRKIFLILLFLIQPFFAHAQDIPQPSSWVNDFADVLERGDADKISSLIEEVEQKTSSEIAVVSTGSIAPYDEKEYARMIFDRWKPGKKGKDNGVLVLLAVKERRWRIETGYGVEGILPDGLCGEIGRNYMVPYFKESRYGEGLYQGVRAIANIIAKDAHITLASLGNFETIATENLPSSGMPNDLPILIIIVLIIIISSLTRYRNGYYGGGYYGGSGGGGFEGGGGFGGFGGGGGGGGGAGGGF